MLNLLHVLRNFNTNEDSDDGDSKEDWLVTQRSALIGLLTLPLTDWEGLDQRRLIPTQPIVLRNLLSELLHRKYHKICPRAVINNQMKKNSFTVFS